MNKSDGNILALFDCDFCSGNISRTALRVEVEEAHRAEHHAEDAMHQREQSGDDLKDIIQKLQNENRDLKDSLSDSRQSADQREKDLSEQVQALNVMVKNLKSKQSDNSNKKLALGLLAGAIAPKPKDTKDSKDAVDGGTANKSDAAAKLNAMMLKQQGKAPDNASTKNDDAKSALNAMLASKSKTAKPIESSVDKGGAAAKLNAMMLKQQGKSPSDTASSDKKEDAKGALGALFAAKSKGSKESKESKPESKPDPMAKYTKMKKIGMPMVSIKNKMRMDGIDKVQIAKFAGEPIPKDALLNGIDLSEHDLSKYEKMKKFGMPEASVRNKMRMDGIDPKVIATYFGEKLPDDDDDDDDGAGKPMEPPCPKPDMTKYTKMKKIGMPEVSVRNKMKMDQIDEYWVRDFFGEPQPIIGGKSGPKPMEPPCPKPDMAKYDRMKKVGMPEASVRNKMRMDGIDPYWVRDFYGEPQPMVGGDDDEEEAGAGKPMEPPCPKPDMNKYEKMKKIGMPESSVCNKMRMDGIDPYWIRDYFGEPQPIVGGGGATPMKAPSKKPCFDKYDKMKKVGLPSNSIRNKMKKDGIHDYWIRDFFGEPQPMVGGGGSKKKKGKKVKRAVKALHWRKKSDCDWNNTIWGDIDKLINVQPIEAPESVQSMKAITTETLITPQLQEILLKIFSNVKPKKEKKGDGGKGGKKKEEEKKEISLIDPKRGFNMVVGLRQFEKLGIDDIKIRNYLLRLDDTKLNNEMLESLGKFVPTNEELNELRNFQGNKELLARGDRFVLVLLNFVDIKMRIDLWRFKMNFRSNLFEVESRINQIHSTLNALQSSSAIAGFMKICLIIGNFMNEGTNRGDAKGIKLESVDRFASMKTVDNKQTMLMFVMNHIQKEYGDDGRFDNFPGALTKVVESAKKIEAKTIRDGINDMRDSLKRIGKQIERVARDMNSVQAHFHQSAGNVLKVLGKLRKNATKLQGPSITLSVDVDNDDGADSDFALSPSMTTPGSPLSPKSVTFEVNEDQKENELNEEGQGMKVKKPRKFKIVDPEYTGSYIVRDHIPRGQRGDEHGPPSTFSRQETLIDSDDDFDSESGASPRGLKVRKTKMKKVKIKRMRRVKRKEKSKVSAKTSRTIKKLREQKQMASDPDQDAISSLQGTIQRSKSKRRSSIHKKIETEDPKKAPPDKFESIMTGFHTMSCNKVDALEKQFANLKIFAGNVAVFFGEHDDMEWEDLFKLFLKFFELISKAKKQNAKLAAQKEKERKKAERERKKKERMAKRGLKAKVRTSNAPPEPTNILEEIKMKSMKGTLKPSEAKNDVVGFEKVKE